MKTSTHKGLVLLEVEAAGASLATDQDAVDLIAEAIGISADIVVVPLARFDAGFLDLRSGIAGAFFQKFQNYRQRLAVIGDLSAKAQASKSLRDFVHETNRSGFHLFAPTREALLPLL
ncbi:MAG: DUF4180 domain-containing protein [Hyphomonadaceae bacterium]